MRPTLRSTVLTLTVLSTSAVGMSLGCRDLSAALDTGDEALVLRVEQLTRTIDELTRRVSTLENAAPREGVSVQSSQRVTAPFEVVDKTGNVILSVTDSGVTVLNAAGKAVVTIGPDPRTRATAMVKVIGGLQLVDASGNTVLDMQENNRRITGPLGVTDKTGNPILSVSDAAFASVPKKGRVHIGRASADNFVMWVGKANGTLAATIGETKEGGGLIAAYDNSGNVRAELWGTGSNGINVYTVSGKPIISLRPHESDPSAGVLRMTGNMQLVDKSDKIMVEAGGSKAGMGLVGAYGRDGTIRGMLTGDGVEVRSPSGKDVASLSLDRRSSDGGVVAVTGLMQIFDAKGTTTVEMGTVPAGVGVVRVGPVFRCGPSAQIVVTNMPTCMMGLVK